MKKHKKDNYLPNELGWFQSVGSKENIDVFNNNLQINTNCEISEQKGDDVVIIENIHNKLIKQLNELDIKCLDEDLNFLDLRSYYKANSDKLTTQQKNKLHEMLKTATPKDACYIDRFITLAAKSCLQEGVGGKLSPEDRTELKKLVSNTDDPDVISAFIATKAVEESVNVKKVNIITESDDTNFFKYLNDLQDCLFQARSIIKDIKENYSDDVYEIVEDGIGDDLDSFLENTYGWDTLVKAYKYARTQLKQREEE